MTTEQLSVTNENQDSSKEIGVAADLKLKAELEDKRQERIKKKYLIYLNSPTGRKQTQDDFRRGFMSLEERNADFLSKDPIAYMQTSSMGIHDYCIELQPSGDIKHDAKLLFTMINAGKLVDRLSKGEDAVSLLLELRKDMQFLIDNSEQEDFKKHLWKAIEVVISIDDILENKQASS